MKVKRKLVMLLSIMVFIGISGCSKDDDDGGGGDLNPSAINTQVVNGNEYNDWIVTVKALIETETEVEYTVATSDYKNGGFKLNFPDNVPSEYLEGADLPMQFASDKDAKIGYCWILAYDEQDRVIGGFDLIGGNSNTEVIAEYVYADRNFTVKRTEEYGDSKVIYDLSFQKGWNIVYNIMQEGKDVYTCTWTTQNPGGIDLKWYFDDDYW